MAVALVNGRVLIGRKFVTAQAVVVEDGRIRDVTAGDLPDDPEVLDLCGHILVPGFIDVQVNGGGDRLFNDDPSVETIAAIARTHRQFGTTGFLPTLISDDSAKIAAAIDAARTAIAAGVPGVLGVHIEGPFLNPAKKGIHDPTKLRPISNTDIELLSRPTGGKTVVTLAPEAVPADAIRQLAAAGVVVAALYDQNSWCGIIADGHHVDPRVLKIAFRATALRRFMLVTDAMPSVGGSKSFMLNSEKISAAGGKCVNAHGTLAGSDLDMATAVRNAVTMLGLDLADAAMMASANPATFLGVDHELGRIAPGMRASLVLLNDQLQVVETWIDGVRGQ